MVASVGTTVQDFTGTDSDGNEHTLDSLIADGPLVLFFYPKASTPTCTKQSCHFRDLKGEFESLGANVIGISADKADAQKKFIEKNELNMPLLCDSNGSIAKTLGVKRIGPLPPKRVTFVIDQNKKVIGSFKSETDANSHGDQALDLIKSLD